MIRQATNDDYNTVLEIYATARSFMKKNGNPTQWGTFHPPIELTKSDIENGILYVAEQDGRVWGCFALLSGEDPTYVHIDGAWLSSEEYLTVHRVASDGSHKGLMSLVTDYVFEKCPHIRIDTHEDNIPMQRALANNGFCYCGIIYLENGEPRMAYEKK